MHDDTPETKAIHFIREEQTPNLILDDKFFFRGDDTTIAP